MNTIEKLIDLALEEDIGTGDVTTENLISPESGGSGQIVAKEALVLAGLYVARKVFERFDPDIAWQPHHTDGDTVDAGGAVLTVSGKLQALLKGERVALDFLQRLSGVATLVRAYTAKIPGGGARLVDTRKTTPGWRVLEKYAVRVGGAGNHRMGLYDGVLIKDNHIAALPWTCLTPKDDSSAPWTWDSDRVSGGSLPSPGIRSSGFTSTNWIYRIWCGRPFIDDGISRMP